MKTFSYHLKYKYCWALVKPNSSFSCKNSFYWLICKPLGKGGSQKDKIKKGVRKGRCWGIVLILQRGLRMLVVRDKFLGRVDGLLPRLGQAYLPLSPLRIR
jgi:hypothetical protein